MRSRATGASLEAAMERGLVRPASTLAPGCDPGTTRRFLEILGTPEAGCTELRVLHGRVRPAGQRPPRRRPRRGFRGGSTLAGWYDDVERLAAQSRTAPRGLGLRHDQPVRPDLLARSDNRLARCRHTTRDADIACLRWLYLDIDPVRPAGHQQHRRRAGRGAGPARRHPRRPARAGRLGPLGLLGQRRPGSWSGCPTTPTIRRTAPWWPRPSGRSPAATATRAVVIDTATVNPARLIGLPGTLKAKGSTRPERPWRLVTLDGVGPPPTPAARPSRLADAGTTR